MKKISILYFLLFAGIVSLTAQQETHYTMYMFNKLNINPAYAGSKGNFTMFGLYRNQWLNLDGAPKTFNVSMHTPFMKGRNGVGLSLIGDQIGLTQSLAVNLSYAYRIPVGDNGTLSLGLQGQYETMRVNWQDAQLIDVDDNLVALTEVTKSKPNFGAGIYYATEQFYMGVSMPQFFVNNLYDDDQADVVKEHDFKTYYFMAGAVLPINESVKFQPAVLFSHNPSAPFEMDLNANFVFLDALWVGGSWRMGDSFDLISQYQFSPNYRAGLAFDFTTSDLRKATPGGFEIMMEYVFSGSDKDAVNNIRFF